MSRVVNQIRNVSTRASHEVDSNQLINAVPSGVVASPAVVEHADDDSVVSLAFGSAAGTIVAGSGRGNRRRRGRGSSESASVGARGRGRGRIGTDMELPLRGSSGAENLTEGFFVQDQTRSRKRGRGGRQ